LTNNNNSAYENVYDLDFNEQLRHELRYEFVKTHKDYYEQICERLGSGDFKTAWRLTYTIKSSAGLICEPFLAKLSGDLVACIIKGDSPDECTLADFKNELDRVIAEIGVKKRILVSSDQLLGKDESFQLLNRVEPLIVNQNGEFLSMLESLRKIPGSEVLCENLESYNFDKALSELINLRETL